MDLKTVSGNGDLNSCGYVPYLDSFLYIDMDGKVLSVTKDINNNMPVIAGLKFSQFTVGGYLDKQNSGAIDTAARLVKLFQKYELDDNLVTKIDVSDINDIHLYTTNIYVTFGSIQNADEKIRTLKEIAAKLHVAEGVKGLLDISVIGRQYIFKVLA